MAERLLILVGKAGVGKTTIRRPLASRLAARAIGPDDHPRRWDWAVVQMDRTPRVVLECCRIPRAVRARMGPSTVVVELTASEATRKWHLQQQGHDLEEVARRLGESYADEIGLGYEDEVTPTLTVDVTTAAPLLVAAEVADHARTRWGEGLPENLRTQ